MTEAPYRVLVVDDQPQNVMVAEALLKGQGYIVDKAADGFQCLDRVAANPPDLILLDVMMPGMDGFEVCRRLKGAKEHRHIPIVLLTALSSTEDRVTGIEAGADDFITKPFNRHELTARVRSMVKVKRLEENDRKLMRRTLERYVEPAVAAQMLENPDLMAPGGRRQDASVLFTDVRGFTAWSEQNQAEAVVEVINRFLAEATAAVFRYGGMVDKFTGDGLMAVFGAPVAHEDHPARATAAALEIIRASAAISHPSLTTPLRVGCGVNSGEMVVGNIGSELRLDYTAMGDAVNVSRRLCEEAGPGQVLVGGATFARLGGAEAIDLGQKQMKNRTEPVHTYAITRLT